MNRFARISHQSMALALSLVSTAAFSGSLVGQQAGLPRGGAVTSQLIVQWRGESERALATVSAAADQAATRRGVMLSLLRRTADGARVLKLSRALPIAEAEALAREIAAGDPDVVYAEPDRLLQPQFTPNDTRYGEQWHYLGNPGGINVPVAWDRSTGKGVTVAVLDTGYRPHPDLAANIIGGYDFISDLFVANDGNGRDGDARDPGDAVRAGECGGGYPPVNLPSSWHGTHVAGTVAALTNNGSGVAGVAFGARVLPVRVLGKCGGYLSDIADGIVWATGGSVAGVPANPNPARVVNMSLGGFGACGVTLQNAINGARSRGATVVVAAGNSNTDASQFLPANCTGVVTVAAVNRAGGRAYYSNYGSIVDLAAPGGDTRNGAANGVLSTLDSGTTVPSGYTYGFYQGTSMATPHVAGVAALLLAVRSALTPDQVENLLKNNARVFPAACSGCGRGIVNASAALGAALGGVSFTNTTDYPIPDNNANGTTSSLTVNRSGDAGSVVVEVDIRHPNIGDLVVELIATNGSIFTLHNRTGGSADHIIGSYRVAAGSIPASGTWRLRVRDRAYGNTGYINSWKLTFGA